MNDAWKAAGYTRKPTREEFHREALAKLPPWTADPLDRLEHTLAAHTDTDEDTMALYATSCSPAIEGLPSMTGVTWGDLREIAKDLRAHAAEIAAQAAADTGAQS